MATPYEVIFDKFIKRLKNDKEFLNYKNLTSEEIEILVKDHLNSLLDQAIGLIYDYGNPDYEFYNNKDDISEQFNERLVPQEITLLVDLMYLAYMNEDRNKLKVLGLTFKNSELNVFSPANDRNSFLSMVSKIEKKSINSITNYLSRDRLTWKEKSIYGSGG